MKAHLFCSSGYSATDGSWDQMTFYSYDDAGRMIREDIVYDGTINGPASGVVEFQATTWTKLSQPSNYSTSAGLDIGASYNGSSSNSDSDKVDYLWRINSTSKVIENVKWFPFGPLQQYDQENAIGGATQRTRITRNLAYRITNLYLEPTSGGAANFQVAISEDSKGRVTKRAYTGGATGLQDSYFLYDDQDRLLCELSSTASSCPTSGSNIKNSRSGTYFTAAGDWNQLLRPVPGSTGLMNDFNPTGSHGTTHQITAVAQSDGTPTLGTTTMAYDARGNRSYDDNTSTLSHDRRDYTYDGRGNVVNVHGQYYTGSAWHDYDVGSAFDAKNRRSFKFFLDNSTGVETDWWLYYDALDRLTEIWYVPNAAQAPYTIFQLSWLTDRLVSYAQTDYPGATVSKRYVDTDESGRPIEMWSWPSSGNASRVWAINPSAWGFDLQLVGATVFQPILFTGQYQDSETAAKENDGVTCHRSGVVLSGIRTYDSFAGGYLQLDPLADETWASYLYAHSNPLGKVVSPSSLREPQVQDSGFSEALLGQWRDETYLVDTHDPARIGPAVSVSGAFVTPSGSGEACWPDTVGGFDVFGTSDWARASDYDSCTCGCCLYACSLRYGGAGTSLNECYLGTGPCASEDYNFLRTCAVAACNTDSLCSAHQNCAVYYAPLSPPPPERLFAVPGADLMKTNGE